MNKTFYIIVPFTAGLIKEGSLTRFTSMFNPAATSVQKGRL